MLLSEIMELAGCEAAWGLELAEGLQIAACFAADLMSDVLAFAEPGALLVTGLASLQSAHAADVAELAGILFVAGKRPAGPVLELARAKGLPVLCTPLSMFETCGRLHLAGLRAGVRT